MDIRFLRLTCVVCDSICWKILMKISMLELVLATVVGEVVGISGEKSCSSPTIYSSLCSIASLPASNQK